MNPFERLREIVTALGLSGNEEGKAWFDSSAPVCHEAEKMLRSGRFAEAEAAFRRVLTEPRYAALAKKHMPKILLVLTEAQIRQQKWEDAEQTGARAWALLRELRYRTSPEFAECCRLRAEAAKGRGALEDALRLFLQGLAAVEERKNPKPAEIVRRRIEICALLREMERWEDAVRQAAQAVDLAGERLNGTRDHGDALLEQALCLAGCERFAEAREAGEKAVAVHRAVCGDHSGEVALDYEKLGSICQRQQDYPAAVSYLEKALGIRERQVGGDTSQFALLLMALADLYTLIGRLAPALELLQQAVGKLGPSKDSHLAGALEKLGAMYVRTGRYEDAADCYQRAFDCWSADPDAYAERIRSNREAFESLLPWLPEPQAQPAREAPDPGISVLRQEPGAARTPAQARQAAPGPLEGHIGALISLPSPQSGVQLPPLPGSAEASPRPAPPHATAAPASPVLAPEEGISGWLDPALPAPVSGTAPWLPGTGPIRTPVAAPGPGSAEGFTQSRSTPPTASAENLRALGHSLSPRKDANGFFGWEELEFEPIQR